MTEMECTRIENYADYELSRTQRLKFEAAGYLAIAFTVFLFYRSIALSLIAGLLIRRFLPLYRKHLARKRLLALNSQFRDLLTSLSASVASGRHMEEALIEAADHLSSMYGPDTPIMRELEHIRRSILENHESDHHLLTSLASRTGSEDIASFVQVYLICRTTGGDLEKVISHTSEIISEKMQISEEIRSLTAQKQLEGRMISLMPLVMLLALNLMSPGYISVLYTCTAGRLIMTMSLAGSLFGLWLMERMSHVEV